MNIKKIILENTPQKREEQRINFKEMKKLDNKIFQEYVKIFKDIPQFQIVFRTNSYWNIITEDKCIVILEEHIISDNEEKSIYQLKFMFYDQLRTITGKDINQNEAISIELKGPRAKQNHIFMTEKQKTSKQIEEMCDQFRKQRILSMPIEIDSFYSINEEELEIKDKLQTRFYKQIRTRGINSRGTNYRTVYRTVYV